MKMCTNAGLKTKLILRLYTIRESAEIFGGASDFGEGNGTPLQYSCLENSMDEEPGRLQSMGLQESDPTEQLHFQTFQGIKSDKANMILILKGLDAAADT